MTLRETIGKKRLYLDGGMGTMLQRAGLAAGELPERWNLTHPDIVTEIHAAYLEAGANIVTTNTFGAYRFKYADLEEVIAAGVANARKAVDSYGDGEEKWVAYDIGPLGKLLEPMGNLSFEEAVDIFSDSLRIAAKQGIDLVLIETMNDAYETKAAVLAAKECCDVPVFVTNVYDSNGRLLTGADGRVMSALLKSLGVDAAGMNCSLGPRQMAEVAHRYLQYTQLPVIVSPNAGLPHVSGGVTAYDVTAEEFAGVMKEIAGAGASVLGGCCGTDPEFIRAMRTETGKLGFQPQENSIAPAVTSYCRFVDLKASEFQLGEPLKAAGLDEDDLDDLVDDACDQADDGAEIVTLDLSGTESELAAMAVKKVQELVNVPLALLGSESELREAVRVYNGSPLVLVAVQGEEKAICALTKQYGGLPASFDQEKSRCTLLKQA